MTSGEHPRLARLLAWAPATTADPGDRYADILTRVLTGLLGPPPVPGLRDERRQSGSGPAAKMQNGWPDRSA